MERCGCGDAKFPYKGPAFEHINLTPSEQVVLGETRLNITANIRPCDVMNTTIGMSFIILNLLLS